MFKLRSSHVYIMEWYFGMLFYHEMLLCYKSRCCVGEYKKGFLQELYVIRINFTTTMMSESKPLSPRENPKYIGYYLEPKAAEDVPGYKEFDYKCM